MPSRPNLVFFLGAGFTKGMWQSAPLTADLLKASLKEVKDLGGAAREKIIRNAVKELFPNVLLRNIDFESFLTLMRNIRDDPSLAKILLPGLDPYDIWSTLVVGIGRAVHLSIDYDDYEDRVKQPEMASLIQILRICRDQCESVSIITTNYDLFVDKANGRIIDQKIAGRVVFYNQDEPWRKLRRQQYGVAMLTEWVMRGDKSEVHTGLEDWAIMSDQIQILKVHGSVNWAYCPECSERNCGVLGNFSRDELQAIFNLKKILCPLCKRNLLEWLLVPPISFKDLKENSVLDHILRSAEDRLANADRVIFIGYSLPPEDPHLTQLIIRGRARAARSKGRPFQYSVWNTKPSVHKRFREYFGTPEFRGRKKFTPQIFEKSYLQRAVQPLP